MAGSVTGIRAGKAFVLIEAVDATGKVLGQVRNKLGKFGTEMSNIGRTMAMRAIAALTPMAFAVKAGTSYDDIMRKVEARSEGTAAQMALLRDQTLKLGRAFGILPSALGGIQNIFAQAGFNRGEIANIGPAVAALARAGGEGKDSMMDTENAAKALSSILRGFEMDASSATEVVDKLAVALNASNYNLEDITTSLQYAVPAAKAYNVSIEEMLAVLAAMRDLQIDASIAGTAFRNMMMYVSQSKERDKFNEDLMKLTGNTVQFTDALGNLMSPLKFLPAMLKATEGLGTAQRSELFSGILQARATIPGMAVGRSIGRMSEVLTQLEKADGTAVRLQHHMDAGLGGAFRRFLATLEETAIKFTNALTPALQTATTNIDKLVKCTSDWIIANPGLVSGVVAGTVAFLALGTALVVAGQATIALSALFGVAAALASATSFVIAFAAPWAAAAAGVYLLMSSLDKLQGSDHLGALKEGFKATGEAAKDSFKQINDAAQPTLQHLKDDWTTTFKTMTDALAGGDLQGAFEILSEQIKVTWSELMNTLTTLWEEFQNQIEDTSRKGPSLYLKLMEHLQSAERGMAIAHGFGRFGVEAKLKEAQKELDVNTEAYAKTGIGNYLFNINNAQAKVDALKKQLAGMEGLGYQESITDEYLNSLRETVKNAPGTSERDKQQQQRRDEAQAKIDALRAGMSKSQADARARAAIAANDAHDAAMLKEAEDRNRTAPSDVARKRKEMEDAAAKLIAPGKAVGLPARSAVEALDMRSAEAWKAAADASLKGRANDEELDLARESKEALVSIDKKITDGGIGVLV